jgi:hypothetical protein
MSKSSSSTSKRLPPLRVFVLGAGVSAAGGVPVAKDILRATMRRLLSKKKSDADEVHKALRYLYPSFEAKFNNYPNIEDFLNLLEMGKTFNTEEFVRSEPFSEERIRRVEKIVLRSLTSFLWKSMESTDRLKALRRFAEKEIRMGDVIITFNWDVGLERSLYMDRKEPSFHYFYSRKLKQNQVFLLKPHGSIDWFKNAELPTDRVKKDYLSLDKKISVFKYFDFSEHRSLAKLLPVIVPPVSSKEFKYRALRRTWISAFRALSQATELQVLGYSLPREDQFARFVLRRAIRNNLVNVEKRKKSPLSLKVINPDETVWATFSKLVGGSQNSTQMEFVQALFQDYVATL